MREFKRATEDLKSSWEDQMKEVEEPVKEAAKDLAETGKDVKTEFYGPEKSSMTPTTSPALSQHSEPAVPKEKV